MNHSRVPVVLAVYPGETIKNRQFDRFDLTGLDSFGEASNNSVSHQIR